MSTQTTYGYTTTVNLPFDVAVTKTTELLKEQGFGLLTTIDVKAKMKEKLQKEMEDYTILGACNPSFASQALEVEVEIGLLMPCNVIVYRKEDKTHVACVTPSRTMSMIGKKDLCAVAEQAETKLKAVIDQLATL